MASEKLKLFSKIEIEVLATAQGTLAILTDVPGAAMAQRFSFSIPATTRRPVTSRVPYSTQGHLVQAICTPGAAGTMTIYRARIWGRELPAGQWEWYALPVIETPVEFTAAPLPIPPTPEEWHETALAIPPTPEEWKPLALPIPPTPEEWRPMKLPVKATPEVPDWVDLEVDK